MKKRRLKRRIEKIIKKIMLISMLLTCLNIEDCTSNYGIIMLSITIISGLILIKYTNLWEREK